MKNKLQDKITQVLQSSDSVSINELIQIVNKLDNEGFTEETIIDELENLRQRLIDFDKSQF